MTRIIVCLLALGAPAGALRGQSAEANHLTNVRQVTSDYVKAGEGYFSPDGETIVYQAIREGYPFYQIYSQPLVGGPVTRISTGRGRTTCSYFHPSGDRILFASSHLDPMLAETEREAIRQAEEDRRSGARRRYRWVFDPHMDLFEADREGVILSRLTTADGYDAECAYSPDGDQIVFCSDRDGDPDLYIMDSAGKNVRQLTNQSGYDGGPFFSPDGRWVVYRTDHGMEEDRLQIHAVRADGANDVALTQDDDWVHWAPYWHPTEPWIVWCGADHSSYPPNYDLWMMRYKVDNGRLRADSDRVRITDHPAADVLPVFSPDGKRLMWTSTRTEDESSQLWIADFTAPGEE